MVVTKTDEAEYNRASELKALDETKASVKGLVDSGVTEIPRIFRHPEEIFISSGDSWYSTIPLIDLG
ncbi:hypothetical protein TIFTF001_022599 [Ficus carica]|uniref:Uncharacterized protein n=1 Tax=Ficus carica TaxID=3494 RepID=A0AA88AK97_FICCA|nr:hypothetical protein TIFTF001_022599 [Ficus carica]